MMKINFYSKFLFFLFVLLAFAKCDSSPPPKLSFEGIRDFDLEEALRESKRVNKPLLLYFTGFGCVNCRKMESKQLINKRVVNLISNNYIFIPLSTDDRTKLDSADWKKSVWGKERFLKNVGQVNGDLQIRLTQQGSQPVFAVVENDEFSYKIIGYVESVSSFIDFLKTHKDLSEGQ